MTHLVIRLIILSSYCKTRFTAREKKHNETEPFRGTNMKHIKSGSITSFDKHGEACFFPKKFTPWIVDKNHMFLENNSLFIYY